MGGLREGDRLHLRLEACTVIHAGLIFVAAALVIAAGGVAATLRAKRRQEAAEIAVRAGLEFAASDPFDCTRVSFGLFTKGDGREATNVMWRDDADGHAY